MSRFTTDMASHDAPHQPIAILDGTRVICKVYQDDAPLHDYNHEQTAYAERIVACLNACEGIPTEMLESANIAAGLKSLEARMDVLVEQSAAAVKRVDAIVAQRDELLRARLVLGADRHKLLAQLIRCREMVGHPDNIAEIEKTIAEVQR